MDASSDKVPETTDEDHYRQLNAAKKRLASSDFAANLYERLSYREGNLCLSPFSVSVALGMAYAGARGSTKAEIARVLDMGHDEQQIHEGFGVIMEKFRFVDSYGIERSPSGPPEPMGSFRMLSANRVWTRQGLPVASQFSALIKSMYQAGTQGMDFASAPESCRTVINKWISDHTAGNVHDMLAVGTITALTRLILTNAVYFKAKWGRPFMPQNTRLDVFCRLDGTMPDVPMMRQISWLKYAEAGAVQAVEIPYVGDFSMLILLPGKSHEQGNPFQMRTPPSSAGNYFKDVGAWITKRGLLGRVNLEDRTVDLCLPRFQISSCLSLTRSLQGIGMARAFDSREADFSGMISDGTTCISDIVHGAVVSVDEQGTEAAAATATHMVAGVTSPHVISVNVDRPFVFLIRDKMTGMVLFLGRVVDPS